MTACRYRGVPVGGSSKFVKAFAVFFAHEIIGGGRGRVRLWGAMQPRATMSAATEIPADIDPDWSFAQLPIGRVVHLCGVTVAAAADIHAPPPHDAPAVLSCH